MGWSVRRLDAAAAVPRCATSPAVRCAARFLASLALALLPWIAGVEAQETHPYWIVVAKTGDVRIVRAGDGATVPAGVGSALDAADLLVTSSGSAVLASDGDVLHLGADSEIEVAPTPAGAGTTVILRKGAVQAKVRHRPDPPQDSFQIRTDYLAATVKGTIYAVRIEADQVAAAVEEGTVRAAPVVGRQLDDTKGLDLGIGETAIVYKAHPGIILRLGEPLPDSGEPAGAPAAPPAPSGPPAPPTGGNHDNAGPTGSAHEPAKGDPDRPAGDPRS